MISSWMVISLKKSFITTKIKFLTIKRWMMVRSLCDDLEFKQRFYQAKTFFIEKGLHKFN